LKNEPAALGASVEEGLKLLKPTTEAADVRPLVIPTFLDLYRQAVLRCLAVGNMTWTENAFTLDTYPDPRGSADALRHLVVRHLLKEGGDAKGAAAILEALTNKLGIAEDLDQKFYRLLSGYTAQELAAIDSARSEAKPRTLWPGSQANAISLVLWGDDYIGRFEQYCARSLAADGNVPALKARGPATMLIHTAARDVEKIRGLPSLRKLGIKLRIWVIPDELLEVTKGDSKYWLLGALQSIHLFYAARRGANFLPIFPDVVYSARYFESLADLAHKGEDAVFLSGFRASRKEIAGQLEQYAKKDAYVVPASRLIELALRHIDAYLAKCFVDPASGGLPRNRVLFNHCGDHLEIRAPHYNPVLIRNSVIRQQPARYLMTLDSEIDKVLPPTSLIHFRTTLDDYFATEVVDDEPTPPGTVGFEEYASFFVEHANAAHLRFEQSPYRIAIHPEWIAAPKVSAEQLADCFGRIHDLVERRLALADRFDRPHVVWHVLKTFGETDLSEQDRQLLAEGMRIADEQLIAHARRLYAEGRLQELDGLVAPVLRMKDPPAELVVFAGHCRHYLGLRKEALTLYRRAQELDPDLAALRLCLAAFREDPERLSDPEEAALLPGFSLPPALNMEARRFLDRIAAPNLSTLYTNDNMIVFQRALTFMHDSRFLQSIAKASETSPSTIDDRTWRVHILLWAARSALNLEGDFVELGTYRAYFAGAIVDYLDFGSLDRKLYLYDTFEGLPDDAVVEDHLPESFYASLKQHYSAPDIYDSVCARFASTPNVTIVRGKLPDTLHGTCPERIAWLHVDLNSAAHEIASLEYLWSRIVVGGFIILDDYGFAIFSKQTEAHQRFFRSKGLTIAELPTGQGLVVKTRDD